MYIRAKSRASASHNRIGRWRGAALVPLSPTSVLGKLLALSGLAASPPRTPPQQIDLDLLLLQGSPSDSTELRQAEMLLNATIQASHDVFIPSEAIHGADKPRFRVDTS